MKNGPAPDLARIAPKMVNRMMKVAHTFSGTPKMPSSVMYSVPTKRAAS